MRTTLDDIFKVVVITAFMLIIIIGVLYITFKGGYEEGYKKCNNITSIKK